MAPDSITIRFPDGAWEYGVSDAVPKVGDTLHRLGKTWVVVDVTSPAEDQVDIRVALADDVSRLSGS